MFVRHDTPHPRDLRERRSRYLSSLHQTSPLPPNPQRHLDEVYLHFFATFAVIESVYLTHPAAESRHGGLNITRLFLIFYLFLTIPVGPVISKSTGPDFVRF